MGLKFGRVFRNNCFVKMISMGKLHIGMSFHSTEHVMIFSLYKFELDFGYFCDILGYFYARNRSH